MRRRRRRRLADEHGQAVVLLVGVLVAVLVGALVLGGVARGIGARGASQRAADLAALAGAWAMRDAYPRLFTPATIGGRPNPTHIERTGYLALARRAAVETARRNGGHDVAVGFPDSSSLAPLQVRVTVGDPIPVGRSLSVPASVSATAQLGPVGKQAGAETGPLPGAYSGPFAYRQGRPMRPDVALAFDRMAAAARDEGVGLVIVSAFRSDAEQARLFAAHPDPHWVARPGTSLHRLGTELDLGPPSALRWLQANAARFHFMRRYAWEPWHFGFTLNAGTASLGYGGERGGVLPAFVPERFAAPISAAAQRWNVSAALLSAQLWQESHFNPFARSGAGALGIAQFMPGTARTYGLGDPFDAASAIDAQAHLMRDLLRQFGSVPLALAAYNAGPGPVRACGCVPPIPETLAYVSQVLGMLNGAGDASNAVTLGVRLVA